MVSVNRPRLAVIQFPGSNCENETLRALDEAGLEADVFRWNRPAQQLHEYDGYIVPGGFSYEDRIRAGVVAAKEPLMDQLGLEAEAGKPILGICNGAQVLLETGLVPGWNPGQVDMALAPNYITSNERVVRRGHHCGWVNMKCEVNPERTPFTNTLTRGEILPITVSHGEGRFTSNHPDLLQKLEAGNQIVWRYCDEAGETPAGLPANPNGSLGNIAGLCNPKGNVLALMPHPERAFYLRQVPTMWPGPWGKRRCELGQSESLSEYGPGFALFQSIYKALASQF